jgi:apolipoprotein N-acyltransferase
VITLWTPENLSSVRSTEFDPFADAKVSMLYGGLCFRTRGEQEPLYFNTAFARDIAGNIVGRYHKKVLMPFGEYIPLASWLPWLSRLNVSTVQTAEGDLDDPLCVPLTSEVGGKRRPLSVTVLICYEDAIPSLSSRGASSGAHVLVNLSNDAWFGLSSAPYQHHLLAAWRAIETRRYLLRVTNTGLTAVVDPLGRTVGALPIFSEGFLLADITPLSQRTLYARWGNVPVYLLIALLACCGLLTHRRDSDSKRRT